MDENKQRRTGRWKLFAVLAVCAAPLIASYMAYYVIKPEGRTNYGTLIDPRAYPIPALGTTTLEGTQRSLESFKGKWLMLFVHPADCEDACRQRLHQMRQLRLAQGKDMDRIERIWLITDKAPLDTMVMREYDGTHLLRADRAALRAWLPTEAGTVPSDHFFLVDPLGNLMMRFPKDADPNKIKKDLSRLLKASRIG